MWNTKRLWSAGCLFWALSAHSCMYIANKHFQWVRCCGMLYFFSHFWSGTAEGEAAHVIRRSGTHIGAVNGRWREGGIYEPWPHDARALLKCSEADIIHLMGSLCQHRATNLEKRDLHSLFFSVKGREMRKQIMFMETKEELWFLG